MHGMTGEKILMRIHIGERDRYQGVPLYEAIVNLLRERHFAGVEDPQGGKDLLAEERGATRVVGERRQGRDDRARSRPSP